MRFDPPSGDLVCDHCGRREDIARATGPAGTVWEENYAAALAVQLPATETEEIRVTECPSCGAEVELGEDLQATECPFCATPVVTGTGTRRLIKPKGLLPFAQSEEQAREAMVAWLGSLWFAPNGLQQYARKGRRLDGIYVPYWTFDAQTQSRYSGERGDDYYTTRTVMQDGKPRTVQVRQTRWRRVSGRVARFFDDVLVLASTSLPKQYTDALEPWDLAALEPYAPDYLAGFRAEGYQVDLRQGFEAARVKMDSMILRDVRFDIGGDHQRVHGIQTDVSAVTFKHILLPVWLAAYKYRGQSFRCVVNGRTGRVQGERPYSPWKIALASIAALVAAALLYYVYLQTQ